MDGFGPLTVNREVDPKMDYFLFGDDSSGSQEHTQVVSLSRAHRGPMDGSMSMVWVSAVERSVVVSRNPLCRSRFRLGDRQLGENPETKRVASKQTTGEWPVYFRHLSARGPTTVLA